MTPSFTREHLAEAEALVTRAAPKAEVPSVVVALLAQSIAARGELVEALEAFMEADKADGAKLVLHYERALTLGRAAIAQARQQ